MYKGTHVITQIKLQILRSQITHGLDKTSIEKTLYTFINYLNMFLKIAYMQR